MELPSFEDMIQARKSDQRMDDVRKLVEWDGSTSTIKLIGNNFINHHQFENISKTKFEGKASLYETMQTPASIQKLFDNVCDKSKHTCSKRQLSMHMTQAFSRRSPVCFFKPSIAKHFYKKFNATKVLDPTAGWGGRMLGAYACGIEYIGIDTNTDLKPAYASMIDELNYPAKMIWDSCLNVDFSTLDYDFVLTSPPYFNKEIYENMKPFENKKIFYVDFLIPMIEKCIKYNKGQWVCININPEYYNELIAYFRPADRIEEYQQSTAKKEGKPKMEYVYCWSKTDCISCEQCKQKDNEIKNLKEKLRLIGLLL
jgi:hypothetical protein